MPRYRTTLVTKRQRVIEATSEADAIRRTLRDARANMKKVRLTTAETNSVEMEVTEVEELCRQETA